MKDYFSTLEIASDSNETDIRKAYRRLAKKYHPDINKAKNAHEKFIEISEAYEILINQIKHPGFGSANLQTDFSSQLNKEYERLRQEAREKAQRQAKMRYEELIKQHEAFLISGLNDLLLLATILGRIAIIPIFLVLLLFPTYLAITEEWKLILLSLISWPFAGIVAWNAWDKRKGYFKPGEFYYSFQKIKGLFTERKQTDKYCYYSSNKKADSHPYKLTLLKLKDIKVKTSGFRQHNANYVNDEITIEIPRSGKAFIIHSINILIKALSIISCLIFFDISSFLWRIIFGMFIGGIAISTISNITHTKSNISYLLSIGSILRVISWILLISFVTEINLRPFDISCTNSIYFILVIIFFLDNFLMAILKLILGKYAYQPILKQHPEVEKKFNEGFKVYNDVIIISVVYPIYRWIFG